MLVAMLAAWYWSDGSYTAKAENKQLARAGAFALVEKFVQKVDSAKDPLFEKLGNEYQIDTSTQALIKNNFAAFKAASNLDKDKDKAERSAAIDKLPMERTFDFIQLKARYGLFLEDFEFMGWKFRFAIFMFICLYIAFAIKVPVFPFHTWLPWAHVEAPTAISVILAGILLKMGVYGFLRIAYPLFPTAAVEYAVPIALFGVFNILYGACCALAQDDLKKIVAYSSVSHMGYCMLGLAALTANGITGSVLQMFNHGTSTSMMFLLVGVIYDRAHHRDVNRFGGLAAQLPVYAGIFTVALFASMGLPGLSGFISEILVFLGAFNSSLGEHSTAFGMHFDFTTLTAISAIGVVLTAAYLLWMMQRVFFGPLNEKYKNYQDLSGRELFTLVPLVVVVIALGVYPKPLIDLTKTSVVGLQKHVVASVPKMESSEKRAKTEAAQAKQGPTMEQPREIRGAKTAMNE